MKKALVLGAGRVGALIATDLSQDMEVVVSDIDIRATRLSELQTVTVDICDLSNTENVKRLIETHNPDVVVGAMPSVLGYQTLETVIKCHKNYVDISFMPEDPKLILFSLAAFVNVTAIVDCGVMPGLGNMIAGHAYKTMKSLTHLDIFVGGVPRFPEPPYFYKAPFAPTDVMEEYTRPARLIENGKIVTYPALSNVEDLWIGDRKLETFNTDGLRTLLTLPVPNMREKTIRWPGHAAMMQEMITEPYFKPSTLYEAWKYNEGEQDITFMNVTATGDDGSITWKLIDVPTDGNSSMARTTAFPCAVVARMLANGRIKEYGVHGPEVLGRDVFGKGMFSEIMEALKGKGLDIVRREWGFTK